MYKIEAMALKRCKNLLALLATNSLLIDEKNKLIEEIYTLFRSLNSLEQEKLNSWLEGRYRKFLAYILKYKNSLHSRIDFAYDIFRWGKVGVIAQDIDFSLFLIKPIIENKVDTTKEVMDYAQFTYGTIMFHKYRESLYEKRDDSKIYYEKALKALLISSSAKSLYLQQRSYYFLSQVHMLKKDFNRSLVTYINAISYENTLNNQYSFIFSILIQSIPMDLENVFKEINTIFTKENIKNNIFWQILYDNITIEVITEKIKIILEFNLLAKDSLAIKVEEKNRIKLFCELFVQYYSCLFLQESCTLSTIQSLYYNQFLTEKGKSFVLFRMGEEVRDNNRDLNRAMLMFSESINFYRNNSRFIAISNLILDNFAYEIRAILKLRKDDFISLSANRYCYEQSMGKSAWVRFVKEGFVTGYFEEEIEFLEYIKNNTSNEKLISLTNTRLAFLYYMGHAGIRIHDYNQPDYYKAEALFKSIEDNPLVTKYLKHPILSIYNKMETIKDNEHYLFFEKSDSNKLLIVFSCAFSYAHYTQLYTFYEKNKINVLFLNNPKLNWYSDIEWERVSKTIENMALKKFNKKNIITYFGSMGGYVALKVGLTYGFKSIVFNPQFDMNIWLKHRPVLRPRLNEVKELINLQDFKTSSFEKTPIYYMTSSSIEDVEAFDIFIESISVCQNGLFIIEKISRNIHAGIFAKVYQDRQQEAILNIADTQERYFNSSEKIAYKIASEDIERFWHFICDSMALRVIIQIIDGQLRVAEIENDFSHEFKIRELKIIV